jgi:hypothetical protein
LRVHQLGTGSEDGQEQRHQVIGLPTGRFAFSQESGAGSGALLAALMAAAALSVTP